MPIATERTSSAPAIITIAAAPARILSSISASANKEISKTPKEAAISPRPANADSEDATIVNIPIAIPRTVNAPAITTIAAAPTKTFGAMSLRANRLTSKVPKVITIRTNPSPAESIEAMSEKAPIATARAVNAADIMSNAAAPAIALAFNLLRSSIVPINAANVAAIKAKPSHAESISATLAKVFNAPAVILRAIARRSKAVPILIRDF